MVPTGPRVSRTGGPPGGMRVPGFPARSRAEKAIAAGPVGVAEVTLKTALQVFGVPVVATGRAVGVPPCGVTLRNGSPLVGSETRRLSVTGPGPTTPAGDAMTAAQGGGRSSPDLTRVDRALSLPGWSGAVTASK